MHIHTHSYINCVHHKVYICDYLIFKENKKKKDKNGSRWKIKKSKTIKNKLEVTEISKIIAKDLYCYDIQRTDLQLLKNYNELKAPIQNLMEPNGKLFKHFTWNILLNNLMEWYYSWIRIFKPWFYKEELSFVSILLHVLEHKESLHN